MCNLFILLTQGTRRESSTEKNILKLTCKLKGKFTLTTTTSTIFKTKYNIKYKYENKKK